MRKIDTKGWIAIGCTTAFIIMEAILITVKPWAALCVGAGFIAGGGLGYYVKSILKND